MKTMLHGLVPLLVMTLLLADCGCISPHSDTGSGAHKETGENDYASVLSEEIDRIMQMLRDDLGPNARVLSVGAYQDGVYVVTGYVEGRRFGEGFKYHFGMGKDGRWVVLSKDAWIR